MYKRILTFQDISCLGQCSLTVALPVISAFGIETCVLPSAVLSTHTGIKGYTRLDLTTEVKKIMAHFLSSGIKFDALYTGYLASAEQIDLAIELSNNFLKDGALIIVDPVMADNGKFYDGFDENFAKKMSELTKIADIITPNVTEAFILAGKPYNSDYTKQDIAEISEILLAGGAKTVVITGISFDEETSGAAYFYGECEPIYYETVKIKGVFHGTGDLFASCLTGALISGKTISEAVKKSADFVVSSIIETRGIMDTHTYGVCFEKALRLLSDQA